MFKKKASRPLHQLFSESFQYLITHTDVFPDPEEVNSDGQLSADAVDHLVFEELVLAFIIIRLELGAKDKYKSNLVHVHEEFFAGIIDALDKYEDILPPQPFGEAIKAYEKVLNFEAEITDQLVDCYNVLSFRLGNSASGYSSLLTLVKFVRTQVVRPLIKSTESQFTFE